MHFAVSYSNVAVIRLLITYGSNIDAQDILGRTPLMIAIERKLSAAIKILLEANASIYIADMNGETILSKFFTKLPQLPLYITKLFFKKIECKSSENIEMIANNLLNIGCPGYSVLLKNTDVLKLFLENGIAVDNCNSTKGDTALHIAVEQANLEHVKLLIEYGADVNKTNYIGNTPMMQLCHENLDILKILLDQGTILTACNSTGQMQTYYALSFGSREAVELLLQYIDLSVKDMNGQSTLHYLITNENPGVFKELEGKNFDANALDKSGTSLLHLAVKHSNPELVTFLLDHGANVNVSKFSTDFTPLFIVFDSYESEKDAKKCVEILLEHGANAQFVTNNGSSLFDAMLNIRYRNDNELLMIKKRNISLMKPVLAHLAALEFIGTPMNELICNKIHEQPVLKKYFNLYQSQLKQAKKTLSPRILMLSLRCLTVNDDKIIRLAGNDKLVTKLLRLIKQYRFKSHYTKKIRRRLIEGTRMAVLREQAILAISRIIGLTNNLHYDISDRVIRYLNVEDWRRLVQI